MTTLVGPMVATLARARGISTSALAERIGIHRNRLADKIAGRQPFRESEILDLAAALGVPPGRLFDDPLELLGVAAPLSASSRCIGPWAGQRAWTGERTARPAAARHLRLVAA